MCACVLPTSRQRVREQNAKKLVMMSTFVILESSCRLRHAGLGPVSTPRHRLQTSGSLALMHQVGTHQWCCLPVCVASPEGGPYNNGGGRERAMQRKSCLSFVGT